MQDAENKAEEVPVAPDAETPQSEQVAETDDSANAPVDAPTDKEELLLGKFKSVDDLKKGYQELEQKFTKQRQSEKTTQQEDESQQTQQVPLENTVGFESETQSALDSWYGQRRESERALEFRTKHKDELQDPILKGAVNQLIADANAQGNYKDREEALTEAKEMLNQRLQAGTQTAKKKRLQEGQELALAKQHAGTVGEGRKEEPINDDQLSSAEFAKKYNLPRATV